MSTTARVRLTLEIYLSSGWGDGCTLAQVQKQAIDEAKQSVTKMLNVSKSYMHASVVGPIQVDAIIHTEEKDRV